MVLARMLSKQQREQGRAEGIKEGAKERAQAISRETARLGKTEGIPFEELPIEDEDD